MTFRYPSNLNTNVVDYVIFTPHAYRSNKAGANGPKTGEAVVLYMPETTPSMSNPNGWGAVSFEGPLGEITKEVGANLASGVTKIGGEGGTQASIDAIKNSIAAAAEGAPGAARQMAVGAIAGQANMTASQLMALGTGQVYNPNIELLYKGPDLRGFNFQFLFAPKSAGEALEVNAIIKHFKKHSAPADSGAGMFRVPDVFQVVYMSGPGRNKNMNEFKRAAMTNIQVQSNPGLPSYSTFDNGMPVLTALSMTFTEVDLILRSDHEQSPHLPGF